MDKSSKNQYPKVNQPLCITPHAMHPIFTYPVHTSPMSSHPHPASQHLPAGGSPRRETTRKHLSTKPDRANGSDSPATTVEPLHSATFSPPPSRRGETCFLSQQNKSLSSFPNHPAAYNGTLFLAEFHVHDIHPLPWLPNPPHSPHLPAPDASSPCLTHPAAAVCRRLR